MDFVCDGGAVEFDEPRSIETFQSDCPILPGTLFGEEGREEGEQQQNGLQLSSLDEGGSSLGATCRLGGLRGHLKAE